MKRILCLLLIILMLALPSGCAYFSTPNALVSQITLDMPREEVEAILGEPYFIHTPGAPGAWDVRCYKAEDQYVFIYYLPTNGDRTFVLWIYDRYHNLISASYNQDRPCPNLFGTSLTVDSAICSESFDRRHLWELVEAYDYFPWNRECFSPCGYIAFFPTDDGRCLGVYCADPFHPDSMEPYILPASHKRFYFGEGIFWIIEVEETDYFTGTTRQLADQDDELDMLFHDVGSLFQRDYLREKGIAVTDN